VIALFSTTLFVSAGLLFWIQPMFGRFLLPTLGSTPQVWIASMLFFQIVLLLGYAYGHVLSARLSPRRQAVVHVALVVVATIVLPVGVPGDARAPETGNPVWWQLGLMAVSIGLPFFALSATAPLIQRWLAQSGHRRAADPYFLYRASNAGSIAGLIAYPVLIEPLLGLQDQGRWWTAGYALLVVLMAACAATVLRAGAAVDAAGAGADGAVDAPPAGERPVDWRRRARWVALAFVPSSLMLGATTYITRDIAPVPLLWVLPLTAYLLSFIFAFAPRPDPHPLVRAARVAMPVIAVALVYAIVTKAERPLWLLMALHVIALFTVALVAHGALAADRPHASRLTEFYLWVSVGGALGGVFNALLAPVVFKTLVEYPLAIAVACALYPGPAKERPTVLEFFTRSKKPTRVLDWVAPVLIGVGVALALDAVQTTDRDTSTTARAIVFGLALGIVVNFARRPLRFGAAIGAIFLASSVMSGDRVEVLDRDRSYFGLYRVEKIGPYHEIIDGTTVHGVERTGPGRPEPLSYYTAAGPIGQLFRAMGDDPRRPAARTAIVGLGAGGLACYARPGEHWTFYEIDPTVARIARDPRLFTYLRDCAGRHDIVLGDGRQSLAAARDERFGLIALDAFTSDAVPVHLITREAIALYLRRLRPDGLLLFNISNRYVELEPVLGNLAADLRLTCRTRTFRATRDQAQRRMDSSKWVVMAPASPTVDRLGWGACRPDPGARTWTDDYSNVLSTLRWG
jgi:SAM-dependent methyltransferase